MKKTKQRIFRSLFATLALVVIMSSCKTVYKPNVQNTPLFKEKGEIRATITPSDVQAAYAITENVGVMGNVQFGKDEVIITSGNLESTLSSGRFLGELGVGYFRPLGNSGVFEVYGGGGYGSINIKDEEKTDGVVTDSRSFKASMTKFFVQPSIGFTGDIVDIAFTPRFVGVNFGTPELENYPQEALEADNLDGVGTGMSMFLEPGITFRVGYKWVKLQTQVFYATKLGGPDINYDPLRISFGFHVNIAKRYSE